MITEHNPTEQSAAPLHSRKYLLALVCIAIGILAAGILLRPQRTPPPAITEAERTQLQFLAWRQDLERGTQFAAGRARELLPRVAEARRGLVAVAAPKPGERILIVAPGPGLDPLWMESAFVAPAKSKCDGTEVTHLTLTTPLLPTVSGGAAFTLGSKLAGVVLDCDNQMLLVAPAELTQVQSGRLAHRLQTRLGLQVRPEPDGLVVSALSEESALLRAGLQPGDLITELDGAPTRSLSELAPLPEAQQQGTLKILRGKRVLTIAAGPQFDANGVEWQTGPKGLEAAAVKPGSLGAKWGLKSGDVVLKAEDRAAPNRAAVTKLLQQPQGSLVVRRAQMQILLEGPQ